MPPRPARLPAAFALVLLGALAIGCVSEPGPTATPSPAVPSQTDTDWGRIWDALPPAFPEYPGASPTETGEGPASAILDVGAADAGTVARFYESGLEQAGFRTRALSGPQEDGSFTLESSGVDTTCAVRTTVAIQGTSTIVTVLYGADCPFELPIEP